MILYAQPVCSGPMLHLASRLQKLRSFVIHSAIISRISDILSIDKAQKLNFLVLIINWFVQLTYNICLKRPNHYTTLALYSLHFGSFQGPKSSLVGLNNGLARSKGNRATDADSVGGVCDGSILDRVYHGIVSTDDVDICWRFHFKEEAS
ncbi:unnamed protein product [Lactuca saligna]|uniref:Uncharacterized protein n=1 Tax=Lactuca saligna TaxID=75948 RepID=A0AA35YJR7_LACSI|nr:unnamed protein product [Lactuca saligna]